MLDNAVFECEVTEYDLPVLAEALWIVSLRIEPGTGGIGLDPFFWMKLNKLIGELKELRKASEWGNYLIAEVKNADAEPFSTVLHWRTLYKITVSFGILNS